MIAPRSTTGTPSASSITVTPIPSPILPTKTITTTILGHSTTIITQSFTDRIFITITQLQKFGCLYQASTSSSHSSSGEDLPPSNATITKLVGTEPTPNHTALYHLYVSQVASIVKHGQSEGDGRNVVVSLALKTKASTSAEGDANGESNGTSGGEEDDWEGNLMSSEEERTRFLTIMDLVQQCRVW